MSRRGVRRNANAEAKTGAANKSNKADLFRAWGELELLGQGVRLVESTPLLW